MRSVNNFKTTYYIFTIFEIYVIPIVYLLCPRFKILFLIILLEIILCSCTKLYILLRGCVLSINIMIVDFMIKLYNI